MFICWSFSTSSGKEWTPGVKDVAFFHPTGCDTDQWVDTAKEADKIADWKQVEWPRIQAKARKEKHTLAFIDESGLTQKPAAKNTWAPQGETPVIQMNFNWKSLLCLAEDRRLLR